MENFLTKNANFWAPTWVPRRPKIASKTGLETKHHEVCLRSCVFHPPGGSRTPPGPGYGALRPLIFDDFLKKCLSEASSKTRPEGDEREEKKLREAELLKNASEPRRSGRSPLGSAEASLKHVACVLIVLEQSPWGLRRNVRPSSGGCPPRAKGV